VDFVEFVGLMEFVGWQELILLLRNITKQGTESTKRSGEKLGGGKQLQFDFQRMHTEHNSKEKACTQLMELAEPGPSLEI
jgi:hypothetical protein